MLRRLLFVNLLCLALTSSVSLAQAQRQLDLSELDFETGTVTIPPDVSPAVDPDARIEAALRQRTTTDFFELPLRDAMSYLADAHNIAIVIERKGLFDFGMSDQDPVTLAIDGIRLDAALNILLGQLSLTYVVEDGVLKVTPAQSAPEKVQIRIYDIPVSPQDSGNLMEIIRAIDPYRCEKSHAVTYIGDQVVLIADYQTQRKVRELFEMLSAAQSTSQPAAP